MPILGGTGGRSTLGGIGLVTLGGRGGSMRGVPTLGICILGGIVVVSLGDRSVVTLGGVILSVPGRAMFLGGRSTWPGKRAGALVSFKAAGLNLSLNGLNIWRSAI